MGSETTTVTAPSDRTKTSPPAASGCLGLLGPISPLHLFPSSNDEHVQEIGRGSHGCENKIGLAFKHLSPRALPVTIRSVYGDPGIHNNNMPPRSQCGKFLDRTRETHCAVKVSTDSRFMVQAAFLEMAFTTSSSRCRSICGNGIPIFAPSSAFLASRIMDW